MNLLVLTLLLVATVAFLPRRASSDTWIVIQYDDRPLSADDQRSVALNQAYCKRWGYEHRLVTGGYSDVPPYWAKVMLARDVLRAEPGCRGVFWLDTDAIVVDHSQPLETLASGHFVGAPDNPQWSSPFCAGVWLVRGTPQGRAVVEDWAASYSPVAWTRPWWPGSKWTCSGPWAGPDYEQGAFVERMMPRHADAIKIVYWQRLQSIELGPTVFVCHFAGEFRNRRPAVLSRVQM